MNNYQETQLECLTFVVVLAQTACAVVLSYVGNLAAGMATITAAALLICCFASWKAEWDAIEQSKRCMEGWHRANVLNCKLTLRLRRMEAEGDEWKQPEGPR